MLTCNQCSFHKVQRQRQWVQWVRLTGHRSPQCSRAGLKAGLEAAHLPWGKCQGERLRVGTAVGLLELARGPWSICALGHTPAPVPGGDPEECAWGHSRNKLLLSSRARGTTFLGGWGGLTAPRDRGCCGPAPGGVSCLPAHLALRTGGGGLGLSRRAACGCRRRAEEGAGLCARPGAPRPARLPTPWPRQAPLHPRVLGVPWSGRLKRTGLGRPCPLGLRLSRRGAPCPAFVSGAPAAGSAGAAGTRGPRAPRPPAAALSSLLPPQVGGRVVPARGRAATGSRAQAPRGPARGGTRGKGPGPRSDASGGASGAQPRPPPAPSGAAAGTLSRSPGGRWGGGPWSRTSRARR